MCGSVAACGPLVGAGLRGSAGLGIRILLEEKRYVPVMDPSYAPCGWLLSTMSTQKMCAMVFQGAGGGGENEKRRNVMEVDPTGQGMGQVQ